MSLYIGTNYHPHGLAEGAVGKGFSIDERGWI